LGPISLCNVIYKIISKCLVNWLRPHIHVVFRNSKLLPTGRLILDNALIGFHSLHAIYSSIIGEDSFWPYKNDLFKAYDKIDWNFFGGALLKMCFDGIWVSRIMSLGDQ
jgi:hypothetical protein